MTNWIHAGPTVAAAFLASLVEFAEAFTIVLAAGSVRGWRGAWAGVVAALGTLVLIVLAGGSVLREIPLGTLRFGVGILLLLFGMRWLRKATLRAGGIIALHDEAAAYTSETAALRTDGDGRRGGSGGFDIIAAVAAFNGVLVEGIEVVFIVIATGAASHLIIPASVGAAAAGIVVLSMGFLLRAPLTRVPENWLKFAVGVLLSAFGTLWIGESAGIPWPQGDASLVWIAALYLCAALAAATWARRTGA